MTTLKESPCTYFSTLLNYGESLLNCSLESIKENFSTYEYCINHYFDKTEWYTNIEIEFEGATLRCSISSENKCQIAYLNIENPSDIEYYIRYCDCAYPYNHQNSRWITGYGYLRTVFEMGKLFFILKPVPVGRID